MFSIMPVVKNIVCVGNMPKEMCTDDTYAIFDNSIKEIGLDRSFREARAIFIKPNLTYPTFKEGVTTRFEFVAALVHCLRRINSTTRIIIGEGEGGYNSFSMSEAMKNMGFEKLVNEYPNVEVVNLSKSPKRLFQIEAFGKPYPLELPGIFDEVDFAITCPVPKVHCMTGISLAMKNQWGCVPDVFRLKNHYAFNHIISQICASLKFHYVFLDGKWGLDDNGPMRGNPIELNWFVAANSLGAHDIVVSDMMGVDWRKIRHLVEAEKRKHIPNLKEIQIIGNPLEIKRVFRLRREFWNYPALVAFNSSFLTRLVYLSPMAKIIHEIMYIVRKRQID